MSDLIKRLRQPCSFEDCLEMRHEASDEIERLRAENSVMREYIHECGLSDDDIKMWVEAFPIQEKHKYYVLREYSHTDRRQLWQVVSRGLHNLEDAEFELKFHEDNSDHTQHKFFVAAVIYDERLHSLQKENRTSP